MVTKNKWHSVPESVQGQVFSYLTQSEWHACRGTSTTNRRVSLLWNATPSKLSITDNTKRSLNLDYQRLFARLSPRTIWIGEFLPRSPTSLLDALPLLGSSLLHLQIPYGFSSWLPLTVLSKLTHLESLVLCLYYQPQADTLVLPPSIRRLTVHGGMRKPEDRNVIRVSLATAPPTLTGMQLDVWIQKTEQRHLTFLCTRFPALQRLVICRGLDSLTFPPSSSYSSFLPYQNNINTNDNSNTITTPHVGIGCSFITLRDLEVRKISTLFPFTWWMRFPALTRLAITQTVSVLILCEAVAHLPKLVELDLHHVIDEQPIDQSASMCVHKQRQQQQPIRRLQRLTFRYKIAPSVVEKIVQHTVFDMQLLSVANHSVSFAFPFPLFAQHTIARLEYNARLGCPSSVGRIHTLVLQQWCEPQNDDHETGLHSCPLTTLCLSFPYSEPIHPPSSTIVKKRVSTASRRRLGQKFGAITHRYPSIRHFRLGCNWILEQGSVMPLQLGDALARFTHLQSIDLSRLRIGKFSPSLSPRAFIEKYLYSKQSCLVTAFPSL